jgi:glycosyltransferase involved in cell wall biosynthesis
MYECMANMTPLVATDVGNIGEILSHPDTVWLVPRRDPEALGAAICALLEDPDRRAAMASRAHDRLASHGIEAVAARFGALYAELLQTKSG